MVKRQEENFIICAIEGRAAMELMDKILSQKNLQEAMKRVKSNKGASGIDKMSVEEIDEYFSKHIEEIKTSIWEKKYRPRAVKRVYIPKPNGKKRPLGIPVVVDRVIQQAVAKCLVNSMTSALVSIVTDSDQTEVPTKRWRKYSST